MPEKPAHRWGIAILIGAAIAISYFDRQTLPVAINAIQREIPISNTQFSQLQAAFLTAYAIMYAGGGRLIDVLGVRADSTFCEGSRQLWGRRFRLGFRLPSARSTNARRADSLSGRRLPGCTPRSERYGPIPLHRAHDGRRIHPARKPPPCGPGSGWLVAPWSLSTNA
jgi:hypothetical protein